MVELGGICVTAWHGRSAALRPGGSGFHPAERRAMAARVKAYLVVADEAEYAAALAAVGALRGDRELSNALASFLFPERTDWVDADLATIPRGSLRNSLPCALLTAAVTTVEQGIAAADYIAWDDADLPSLLGVLGPDATRGPAPLAPDAAAVPPRRDPGGPGAPPDRRRLRRAARARDAQVSTRPCS